MMTEAEWLACNDPQAMLTSLRESGKLSERRGQLFAVACCRRIWHLLRDERARHAVNGAERAADERATPRERIKAELQAHKAWRDASVYPPGAGAGGGSADLGYRAVYVAASVPFLPGDYCIEAANFAAYAISPEGGSDQGGSRRIEQNAQCKLILDLFGTLPFRPLPLLPPFVRMWNGGLIQRLAEAAYETRLLPSGQLDPERLAILADALEEAGADAEMVRHLRQAGGIHVRGCHVVDLALGRE